MTGGLLKRYDTFIFDLDGTITRVKLARLLNEKLNPGWNYRKWKHKAQMDPYSTEIPNPKTIRGREIRRHIMEKEIENEILSKLVDVSLLFVKPRLQSDTLKVLQRLRKGGAKVALFTNADSYRAMKDLHYLKIGDYFSAIVSAQGIGTIKPNPLGIKLTLKQLHSKKERAIYVCDMVSDVEAAKYAGVASCAISQGFDTYRQLRGARPTYLMRSMEELLKSL